MIYLGGKHYSGPGIASVLKEHYRPGSAYYEPFVGGGHVLYRVAKFVDGPMHVSDVSPDLMLLWTAVADGWDPPEELSREEWEELRCTKPSALRSAAGFGLSFSGKWFAGYGAADRPEKSIYPCKALARSFSQRRDALSRSELACRPYDEIRPAPGDLVYCDPPYEGTTGYGAVGRFDHKAFWKWAESLATAGVLVFVSEYSAPDGWESCWTREVSSNIKTVARGSATSERATEYLFRWPVPQVSRFIVRPVPGTIARMTEAERLSLFGRPDIPADGDWSWRPPRSPQSVRQSERTDPDPRLIQEPGPSDKRDRSSRDQDVRALRGTPHEDEGRPERSAPRRRAVRGVARRGLVLPEAQRQPRDAGDIHPVVPTGDRVPGPPRPSAYGPSESFCQWCGEEIRVITGNRHFRIWATVAGRSAECPGYPYHFPVAQLGLTWYVDRADATGRRIRVQLNFDHEGRRRSGAQPG